MWNQNVFLYVFNCAFSLVRNICWFNAFYANLCSQEVYSFDTKIIRFGEMYIFHDFRHFEISAGVFDFLFYNLEKNNEKKRTGKKKIFAHSEKNLENPLKLVFSNRITTKWIFETVFHFRQTLGVRNINIHLPFTTLTSFPKQIAAQQTHKRRFKKGL